MAKKVNKAVFIEGNDKLVEEMFQKRGYDIAMQQGLADLIVFTGGADVMPGLYGCPPHASVVCNPTRDNNCMNLYYSVDDTVPMVGICRGGQFLNVMNGGSLWQDQDGHRQKSQEGGLHKISVIGTDNLFYVTSDHHQGMIPDHNGIVLGYCDISTKRTTMSEEIDEMYKNYPDVEIVWYEETRSLCFQPHPEWVEAGHPCQELFFAMLTEYTGV